ncbi:DoxX family protein [Halomonas sediminis]|uniref:DoxX family membrane protein n=1 Tax=Vreelandella zhuhanensis TaxID=2684210 RepID=A0A7X3H0I5_9GAMM|nr:DoxX family protein [Halomonas zhuhanensis]MWJ28144.1 DoxX family membrane protein [Halomonas zhuhanensis]
MNDDATSRPADASPVQRHAHWFLRLGLASVFLYMGIDKFMGGGVGEFSTMMGLPVMLGGLVALGEIGTGLLVVLGGLMASRLGDVITRLGALGMIPILLGAIFMVHWGQWHFMATSSHPLGGMMFQVTLVMIALYLLAKGNQA